MTAQNLIDPEPTLTQMIRSVEDGLPISNFKKLQDSLDLPDKDLAKYIRIPKSTLALRKKRGKFSFEESERLLRLQRLFDKALDVFKDADLAKKWLKEEAYGLGDVPPLEYAATEIGAREVEDLLGRIEHGVFS
jgi:putative toxin-antitoxin system antitoxin component (TIGR02293 family)